RTAFSEEEQGSCPDEPAPPLGTPAPLRTASSDDPGQASALPDHVIVDQHVQSDQEGVQVCVHDRPWIPSRRPPDRESLSSDPRSLGLGRKPAACLMRLHYIT